MRNPDSHLSYLRKLPMSKPEREIIIGFINQRNAIKPTRPRTQGKQAYECVWIARSLGDVTLDTCTVHDLLKVAGKASSGDFTKNSRQTKIVILKALAQYIHRFHHPIENLDLLLHDVKAGSAARNRKKVITLNQWNTIRSLPMSAKSRAEIYMMYYGYHRPGELSVLKWSDLKPSEGGIEYDITFKTEKTRHIVMRAPAIEVLEKWRMECGAVLTDEKPIFPAPDGKPYQTITHLAKLFNRLKKKSGVKSLMPSILRNSGMQHDLEAGYPVSYVCLIAWGEPYNELINLYTRPDSAKIQRDQHEKVGIAQLGTLGTAREYTTMAERLESIENKLKEQELMNELLIKYYKEKDKR